MNRLVNSSVLIAPIVFGAFLAVPSTAAAAPIGIAFTQSAKSLEAYDFVEITAKVESPDVKNPFTDAFVSASFEDGTEGKQWKVEGFCDSANGSLFRVRFMPPKPGNYKYNVTYRENGFEKTDKGSFLVTDGHRRGPIRVDPQHRWHFVWEGTGEHYFFNGTTAYWLIGWREERIIQYSIDRLHRLKVNRIRVTVAGRENYSFYGEPVMLGENFTVYLTPWLAADNDNHLNPGFDYKRFDIAYWQKYERMLRFARGEDMIMSLVLDMSDSGLHLPPRSKDEHRFVKYAVARLSAFSNITWDLGDDLDHFRDDAWTHETGTLLEQWDPYHHLATSHPVDIVHQDRASEWFGFTSYQDWHRKQHALMLESRKLQEKAGRIIPQTNEEYGYEDHYPMWTEGPGSDSADTLRRTAWDIAMAGGYQTSGETARRGTNILPDTGGGWMNGRGDDTMTMFVGYGHMVDFFTSFEWWRTDPHDELVNNGAYCLTKLGEIYAAYLPHGGTVTIQLQPGTYKATWFSAYTGEKVNLPDITVSPWTSPQAPDNKDWALLLLKR